MARYKDAVCRKCRRIGEKLFLKGERCFTPRCAVDRRRTSPRRFGPPTSEALGLGVAAQGEAEGPVHLRGAREAVQQVLRYGPEIGPESRVTTCFRYSNPDSTTSCTGCRWQTLASRDAN